ncbi:MAG: tRNA (N(6)-L-threonylcarbamoyladenosine(37)-C(2))-methylthiotransferase MtaB [Anaerolineae bacterium]|nr:MAG: tRNA (N(6)-L-threonylcarbamoyladenosine(37)-C(2))-methylthiotransferase MtaB [Anaerolineae bacterium]
MKIYLHSIGCRLNQSEIETMARQLMAAGHEIVNKPSLADRAVINTCAVTNQAAKDSRIVHRRIRQSIKGAEVYITGCYATIAPEKIKVLDGQDHIILNQSKGNLVQLINSDSNSDVEQYDKEPILRELLSSPFGHTRAFVKVQDGCDNSCTFCLTTVARGQGWSRHLGDVVSEIQALANAGYQEAVLTGVHLGSYGKDLGDNTNLAALIAAILHHSDIPRLRLSSLEPWDLVPEFFYLWNNPRLLPHLHMPLQSGSDRILRRMARRTTCKSYLQLVSAARKAIPDLSLSTDIITGFPGETEDDYESTFDFVSLIGFSRLHVFSYSKRPGTAAAKMSGHLPRKAVKARTQRMIKLGKSLSLSFHQSFVGQKRNVLWERPTGAINQGIVWIGYTDNYIRVKTTNEDDLFNKISPTWLFSPELDGMIGSIEDPVSERG